MEQRRPPRLLRWTLGASVALYALAAGAQVVVADAWVRATVPGQRTAGAFMQVKSAVDARIVAASSPIAKVVEIHEMKLEGGIMKMRAVETLALPAGQPVTLSPGGYHVMMMGIAQPLKEGDRVALTLVVEEKSGRRHDVAVSAAVKSMTAGAAK